MTSELYPGCYTVREYVTEVEPLPYGSDVEEYFPNVLRVSRNSRMMGNWAWIVKRDIPDGLAAALCKVNGRYVITYPPCSDYG